jgi:hypothetical protein
VESGAPEVQVQLLGQEVKDGSRIVGIRVTPKSPATGLLYAPVKLYGREREQQLTLFASVRAPGAAGCEGCVK